MKILEVSRKIGLLAVSKEDLDDYYISKEIVKKYKEEYKEAMKTRRRPATENIYTIQWEEPLPTSESRVTLRPILIHEEHGSRATGHFRASVDVGSRGVHLRSPGFVPSELSSFGKILISQ